MSSSARSWKIASQAGGQLDYDGRVSQCHGLDAASRTHTLAEAGAFNATQQQYYGFAKPANYTYDVHSDAVGIGSGW